MQGAHVRCGGPLVDGGWRGQGGWLLGVLAVLLFGCSWTQSRPSGTPNEPGAAASAAAPAALSSAAAAVEPAADAEPEAGTPLALEHGLLIRIQEVEGTTAAQAGVLFDSITEPVEQCTAAEPGSLTVRVVSEGERTVMDVAPGTNVDAATRRCVLAAMALLEEDEGLPVVGSPTDRTRTFASTVSISW